MKPANRFVAEFLGIANFVHLPDGGCALVRPERIRVDASGEGKEACIVEVIYLGQTMRYHLAIEGAESLVATVPFRGKTFSKGERVVVSWDVADLWPVAFQNARNENDQSP
ncbi:TOBE domain-containing protein [Bradyrhizobium ottawaense]|uniref:TOBE domain-containing protein n=1 Tax=Bradyrhizobium ottawaense TaxID=931866 RepID=UPI003FA17304